MLKRFVRAFLAFVGIIVPGTFALALLIAPPAHPEPVQPSGCERGLADVNANVAAMQARIKKLHGCRARDLHRSSALLP
ncbi:MAG: hypothetical protein WCF80_26675 [Pseudolabrys sp.]